MAKFYVETKSFENLRSELKEERPRWRTKFVVGCKGVGKSSLVRGLYDDVLTNYEEYNVKVEDVHYFPSASRFTYAHCHQIYDKIDVNTKGYLFIDNIHRLPEDSALLFKDMLKHAVGNKWRTVAASSRHGLYKLIKNNCLSVFRQGWNMLCIGPEKEVGEKIFQRLMEDKSTQKTLTTCSADLEKLGYVPGCILAYVEQYDCNLASYEIDFRIDAWLGLEEDAKYYSGYTDGDELYCKVLGILGSGNSIPLSPFHLSPAMLPWTFLTHQRRDVGDLVSVVSPLVQDICSDYISSDSTRIVKKIHKMLEISGGKLGNLGGLLFEQLIYARLRAISCIKYFYYDDEQNIQSQKLQLTAKEFRSSKKRDARSEVSKIQESGLTGSIVFLPNAQYLDFLLVVEEEACAETHGIQVTLKTMQRKCSGSDFYQSGHTTHMYLLTPHEFDVEETTRDDAFGRAFRNHRLRIIDPSSVLNSEELKLMNDCSAGKVPAP